MSELAPEGEPTIPAELADLRARLERLENELSAEVDKAAGPAAKAAVAAVLEPYIEQITTLVEQTAARHADAAASGIDKWAHAKIGAVVSAVERAIGIKIPLPSHPGEHVTEQVTVPGAETADQLSK